MTALGSWLADRLDDPARAPLLSRADGSHLTGPDAWAQVQATSARWAAFGIGRGDVVALRGLEREPLLVGLLAAWALDAVAWPMSYREPERALDLRLERSGVRAVVRRSLDQVHSVKDGADAWSFPGRATLVQTTGTTALAKIALHSVEAHRVSAARAVRALDVQAGDLWLLSLSLHHIGGLGILWRALHAGATVGVPAPGMGLEEAILALRPTHLSAVATQAQRLVAAHDPARLLQSVRVLLLGGGPVPRSLRQALQTHGVPAWVSYGATETTALIACAGDAHALKTRSCAGDLLVDPDHVRIAADGALAVRGPTRFEGYVQGHTLQPAGDAEGFHDTGDLARLDGTRLYILGRRDRAFISGGENVQPEEVEGVLERLGAVARAVVVPIADATWGQVGAAFLQVQGERSPSAETLRAAVCEHLPRFKAPRLWFHLPTSQILAPKPDLRLLARQAEDPTAHRLDEIR